MRVWAMAMSVEGLRGRRVNDFRSPALFFFFPFLFFFSLRRGFFLCAMGCGLRELGPSNVLVRVTIMSTILDFEHGRFLEQVAIITELASCHFQRFPPCRLPAPIFSYGILSTAPHAPWSALSRSGRRRVFE